MASFLLAAAVILVPACSAQARSNGAQSASTQPAHNPYQAEKEVEVGHFYLDKGKYDAAISRFQNAVKYDPGWAVPHRFLGEAYEKKDRRELAIDEYREYLKITPYAKDARKIQKRIDKLGEELQSKKSANGGTS